VIRTHHLGPDGEEAACDVLDLCELTTDFQPCLLVSPYDRALDEVRRRVAEATAKVLHYEIDDELPQHLRALVDEPTEPRPILWLQQQRFAPEKWRIFLTFFQQKRDLYMKKFPFLWVLAGPPEMVHLMRDHAMHVLTGTTTYFLNDEPKILPRSTSPIRWLHLSDFHFEARRRWDRRATLTALLDHAEKLRERGLAPDFVFVTGDIAQSGQRKEYDQAVLFFTELGEKLGLEPRERFFFVPGNHDVDRSAIGPGDRYILAGLNSQDAIEEVLADRPTMALLGGRLESFYAFTERLLGPARGWHAERPYRVDVREVHGVDVAVLQLNSAWASGPDDDKDGLLVGEAQLRDALEESADAFLRIVLVHHPLGDLRDVDQQRLETLYTGGGVHFLLRGHLHRSRTEATQSPDGTLVELAAGAVYVGGEYPKTHFLTEADLTAGEVRVHFFGYSKESGGFWAKDTMAYKGAEGGVWTLPLPASLRLDSDAPDSDAPAPVERELTDARRATLTARYRTAAAAVHGTVRFVGFADHRPRPNVGVPELFVPLRFEGRRGQGEEHSKDWTTPNLFELLTDGGRVVVLGDPGSGKTTLCRFAAVVLAGEATVEGIDIGKDVLPLFLPFREYVLERREKPELGLVEFLTAQASGHLQVPVSRTFLEEALDDGRAVLLLDGLDEVGSATEREKMRGSVEAFCRLYPKVASLVTSRVAGYDDAPLPRYARGGFVHLVLAPFSDEDLKTFVSHWYGVQDPENPVVRERGIADLLAAFDASPPVQELARNPMLATLIALVHRYEAHLPGERAALYDICVKTMLETWPEDRRTTFKEIDGRLQRSYLETLAYRMQCSRTKGQREVTIKRDALVKTLEGIVYERKGPSASADFVERWVRFLEHGSGLLVEQRPGVFAFFHLSLMEYLAARGMDEAEVAEDGVTEYFADGTWREVCLLAVGSKATEKAFLDRVFQALRDKHGGPSFLLRCLREEADFDDEQRADIVLRAGCALLQSLPYLWEDEQRTLDEILRFSIRHAEWAAAWLREQLAAATEENLRGLIALRLNDKTTVEILGHRKDAAQAARHLLEYWPGTSVGDWAAAVAGDRAAYAWSRASPPELLLLRSLAAEGQRWGLQDGLVVASLRLAAAIGDLARSGADRLRAEGRPEGKGLPSSVRVQPGDFTLPVLSTEMRPLTQGIEYGITSYFASDFASYFVRDFARDSESYFARDFAIDFASYFASDLTKYFTSYFARDFTRDFARYLASYLASNFAIDFAIDFAKDLTIDFANDFENDFSIAWTIDQQESVTEPSEPQVSVDVWERATDNKIVTKHVAISFAHLAAEAWIGLVTMSKHSANERRVYIHRRVENAWLLQLWPAVDRRFTDPMSPDRSALYLTLGFMQATTTWQWPGTERWRQLLGGEPPEHWLPRSQWHLCWLLHDDADAVHRRGLDEALREGMRDAARPGVAVALRELIAER
jgi:predicted MPP superfamily phosphohydrolase